jgi:hypothetical protein
LLIGLGTSEHRRLAKLNDTLGETKKGVVICVGDIRYGDEVLVGLHWRGLEVAGCSSDPMGNVPVVRAKGVDGVTAAIRMASMCEAMAGGIIGA